MQNATHIHCCLVICGCDKATGTGATQWRTYFSFRSGVPSTTAGQWEGAGAGALAAGHTISIVRKQRTNNVPSRLSPLYTIQDPALGLVPPTFRAGLPSSVNLLLILSHRCAWGLVFWVTPDPIKLTIGRSHHIHQEQVPKAIWGLQNLFKNKLPVVVSLSICQGLLCADHVLTTS